MIADEPPHLIAFFGIELKPRQQAVGQFYTLHRVIAGAASLARVVHEDGEEEKVQTVDLPQQRGKTAFPSQVWLAQSMNIVDHQEGMLVDGVAMIGVANYQ